MTDGKGTAQRLYDRAYRSHYTLESLEHAAELYQRVIDEFPGSPEATNARQQLTNIPKDRDRVEQRKQFNRQVAERDRHTADRTQEREQILNSMLMATTPTMPGHRITKVLGVVTAESVAGVGILSEILMSVRDLVGGRSATAQKHLREMRTTCIDNLKEECEQLGGNAVVGISLDYSEVSGKGTSMLMLVASGTAVLIEPEDLEVNGNPASESPSG